MGAALTLFSALALTIGALLVTITVLRRVQGRAADSSGLGLEVLGRTAVGPKQGVALLRMGERVLLLSIGDGGVRTLAEMTPAEAERLRAERGGAAGSRDRWLLDAGRALVARFRKPTASPRGSGTFGAVLDDALTSEESCGR